jgi:urea transport system permease protein
MIEPKAAPSNVRGHGPPPAKDGNGPREIPSPATSWSGKGTFGLELLLFFAMVVAPYLIFADDRYWLPIFTRIMALAIFAMAVDLIWGYTGLLTLGQGLFFGLGAYAVGYSLKMQHAAAEAGLPPGTPAMPDFMLWCRMPAVPTWVTPLASTWVAVATALVLPTIAALFFALFTFRPRIREKRTLALYLGLYLAILAPFAYWWRDALTGDPWTAISLGAILLVLFLGGWWISGKSTGGVFFSLITQALLLAVFTLVDNQQPYTGGRVGMPYLARLELFGHTFNSPKEMYALLASSLVFCFLACQLVVHSKFGKVLTAIRDSETRTLALGYNTAMYKTFVFTAAGAMSGFAGALYTTAQRTVGPTEVLDIGFSIEIVILVAVGGRGTLVGPVLGALLVTAGKTYVNNELKQGWPLILGALFIAVVLFLPQGIVGGLRQVPARLIRLCSRDRSLVVSNG